MHSAESPSLSEAYNETDVAKHDGHSFDERIRIAPEDSRYDDRLRWTRSEASQRGSYFDGNRRLKKRSIGKRMTYAMGRFVAVALIGIAGTLVWQAYGDQARAMVARWDPSLAWLAPLPVAQAAAPAAVSSADLAQQLKPINLEIAAIRQNLEQLAAKQDQLAGHQTQLAQGLSTLAAIEQEVGLKISSMAQAKPKPAHVQPHPLAPAPRSLQPPDEPDGR